MLELFNQQQQKQLCWLLELLEETRGAKRWYFIITSLGVLGSHGGRVCP